MSKCKFRTQNEALEKGFMAERTSSRIRQLIWKNVPWESTIQPKFEFGPGMGLNSYRNVSSFLHSSHLSAKPSFCTHLTSLGAPLANFVYIVKPLGSVPLLLPLHNYLANFDPPILPASYLLEALLPEMVRQRKSFKMPPWKQTRLLGNNILLILKITMHMWQS